jgi:hypothetical protein
MTSQEARENGLVCVPSGLYHDFSGHDKEKLKENIKIARKKYGVRIVLSSTTTGSGYHRSVRNEAYAEPIFLDYLMLERANEDTAILENERAKLEAEYQTKRDDLEGRFISLRTKLAVAANNVEMHKKV